MTLLLPGSQHLLGQMQLVEAVGRRGLSVLTESGGRKGGGRRRRERGKGKMKGERERERGRREGRGEV